MSWYPTQSHYPNTEPTHPWPIVMMPSAWLGNDKYRFLSHWFDSTKAQTSKIQIHWSPKTGDGHFPHSVILSVHFTFDNLTLTLIHPLIITYAYTHLHIHTHTHSHTYTHLLSPSHTNIRRALFRNAISANPKIEFTVPMPNSEIVFWKKLFINK